MHVHILELFLALSCEQKMTEQKKGRSRLVEQWKDDADKKPLQPISNDDLAYLISVYERRGRHNEDVSQGMYEKLYPALGI